MIWTTGATVHVRQQGQDGSWSPAAQLASGVDGADGNAYGLAEADSGAAVFVWSTRSAELGRIFYSVRPGADGAWSAPRILATGRDAVLYGSAPQAAIDSDGLATIAWSSNQIWTATVNTSTETSTPARAMSLPAGDGDQTDLGSLAVSSAGAALLSWYRVVVGPVTVGGRYVKYGTTTTLVTDSRPNHGDWLGPRVLNRAVQPTPPPLFGSIDDSPQSPTSTVTADGTAALAWSGPTSNSPEEVSVRAPTTGRWSTHALGPKISATLVAADDNQIVAVWTRPGGGVFSATVTASTGWAPAGQIATIRGTGSHLILAGAPNTDGNLAYTRATPDPPGVLGQATQVVDAVRGPDGQWSAPQRVGAGDYPIIAISDSGSPVVLSSAEIGEEGKIELKVSTSYQDSSFGQRSNTPR